jgi:hypothetical protein
MMKTNLRAMNLIAAIATALLGAAITLLLTGEASWLKFVAWTIFFTSLQSGLFLPQTEAGRRCAVRLPRLWKRD